MEISYVVKDAKKWEVDPERTECEFDAAFAKAKELGYSGRIQALSTFFTTRPRKMRF